ncbi:hypothetical protein FC83_GL001862 [Agrilactobacillus composti DSM 18527 = JCM 14202]|uniref:Uncharacterized protein n=1 Tax=Agrilactobacillus composti DSM 18527 = JCM 14202 TaxID=1423734 RepID=X0PDT3_9LACO|nr:hypothetical protein [Agrilactobacillus composti]KRM35016.1 hypothetical protein FC83_GL001862 [Agrilactobacillus composti DSM 18527 = JCM 14202]GAF39278.1 hypothetical protein JCM14202_1131 [Agrilactobacillus composti DSM 18527 = JCM 14202]
MNQPKSSSDFGWFFGLLIRMLWKIAGYFEEKPRLRSFFQRSGQSFPLAGKVGYHIAKA